MSAGWTTAWSRRPNVSTRMCRFLPLIFLPASYPCGSMNAPLFPRFSRNGAPRQKPKHNHPTTDPLVNPGNPPHCYQTCSKADSTRTYHRVVFLAQSSPGCRSTRPLQIKKATVMLGLIDTDVADDIRGMHASVGIRSRAYSVKGGWDAEGYTRPYGCTRSDHRDRWCRTRRRQTARCIGCCSRR